MKILHVIRDLSRATGGPVNALKGLAEAQAALGHEVTIVTTNSGVDQVIPANTLVHRVPARSGGRLWSHGIKRCLESVVPGIDIVHAHMVWDYPVWEAARQAHHFGKPFVLRPCGHLEAWSLSQKRFKKMLCLRTLGKALFSASAIHYTSEQERANSLAITHGIRGIVVPLGVLPEFAVPAEPTSFARRFDELREKQIVLFLGRLHPKKRPELVIDAFAAVAGDDPRRHLVLAGPSDDSYRQKLTARAKSRGIGNRVTFTGLLNQDGVRDAIAAADVFVLPSNQENFGISVVEAMAGSCPVVISSHIGIALEVVANDAGIVCPMQPIDISASLRRILTDGALRRRMGTNGHNLVMSRFTWPRVADTLLESYSKLIAADIPGVNRSGFAGGRLI